MFMDDVRRRGDERLAEPEIDADEREHNHDIGVSIGAYGMSVLYRDWD